MRNRLPWWHRQIKHFFNFFLTSVLPFCIHYLLCFWVCMSSIVSIVGVSFLGKGIGLIEPCDKSVFCNLPCSLIMSFWWIFGLSWLFWSSFVTHLSFIINCFIEHTWSTIFLPFVFHLALGYQNCFASF